MSGEEDCYLEFSGGEIHEFTIGNARAKFSGGRVDEMRSSHTVGTKPVGDPPDWVPDKHIEIICRDWDWQESTNILTGTWEDYSTFNIQLKDAQDYTPTIGNIKFTIVPEPATLLMFAVGGFMLRRKR